CLDYSVHHPLDRKKGLFSINLEMDNEAECAKSTDSAMTYADIIQLVTKNMKIRKKQLMQLDQLHETEWAYFNNYLAELQEGFEREMKNTDKKVAEKRKANHAFLSPSLLFDDLYDKKCKGNSHRETAFFSRYVYLIHTGTQECQKRVSEALELEL
ncbi:hypothetical protein STEG23_034312, partial [Scotinomys teguina]